MILAPAEIIASLINSSRESYMTCVLERVFHSHEQLSEGVVNVRSIALLMEESVEVHVALPLLIHIKSMFWMALAMYDPKETFPKIMCRRTSQMERRIIQRDKMNISKGVHPNFNRNNFHSIMFTDTSNIRKFDHFKFKIFCNGYSNTTTISVAIIANKMIIVKSN